MAGVCPRGTRFEHHDLFFCFSIDQTHAAGRTVLGIRGEVPSIRGGGHVPVGIFAVEYVGLLARGADIVDAALLTKGEPCVIFPSP